MRALMNERFASSRMTRACGTRDEYIHASRRCTKSVLRWVTTARGLRLVSAIALCGPLADPADPHVCSLHRNLGGQYIRYIYTHQRDPAQLKPRALLRFDNLGIVATRAHIRLAVALLGGLGGAAEDDRKTEEEVLHCVSGGLALLRFRHAPYSSIKMGDEVC